MKKYIYCIYGIYTSSAGFIQIYIRVSYLITLKLQFVDC